MRVWLAPIAAMRAMTMSSPIKVFRRLDWADRDRRRELRLAAIHSVNQIPGDNSGIASAPDWTRPSNREAGAAYGVRRRFHLTAAPYCSYNVLTIFDIVDRKTKHLPSRSAGQGKWSWETPAIRKIHQLCFAVRASSAGSIRSGRCSAAPRGSSRWTMPVPLDMGCIAHFRRAADSPLNGCASAWP
jgi:hypothetical protein